MLEKIYQEINENINNHDYYRALSKIEEYLNIATAGITLEILNMYIECQIKLGLFDEAIKNIEILYKYFKKKDYFDLAIKYAACCKKDKLEEILSQHTFSPKKYFIIAQYCYSNNNIELAEKLFNLAVNSTNQEIVSKARNKLDIIEAYKQNKDKVFQEQIYGSFKYHKEELKPGHVIMISRLNPDYSENKGYQKINWPYMIWRIEESRIYAFPVVERLDKYRYVIPKENYPGRKDRCLKDRLVCIDEKYITTIIDKIKENDFNIAIESMYMTIIHTRKGNWTEDTKYFMEKSLEDKGINIGDILVLCNSNYIYHYFIFNEDELGYYTYKVGSSFLPLTDNIEVEYVPKDTAITGVMRLLNPNRKELLLSLAPKSSPNKRVLTPKS